MFSIFLYTFVQGYILDDDFKLRTAEQFYLSEDNPMYNLSFKITNESYNQIDIQIEDIEQRQFRIPEDIEPFKSIYNDNKEPSHYKNYDYTTHIKKNPFELEIIRIDTHEKIFHISDIVASELYSEFKLIVPTQYFFGLGERNQKGFRFKEGIYNLLAKDAPELMEDGQAPGKAVYGSHPVYLMREKSGKYHVFFFKNASPMDVIFSEDTLNFKFIGGIIHLKLFLGDYDPETAIKLYHTYLGGWALHPFWSMGYHHSRWPIKTSNKLKTIVKKHKENLLPLDTIWSDIDYMFDRQIFSVDISKFNKEDFSEIQNELSVNYITLVDVAVGVKYGKEDRGFREGIEQDIFVRSPTTGTRFKGYVWPGPSYFPDFFHPNCSTYWRAMIKHLHTQTNFSGIWIDMNEPANFCDGECEPRKWNKTLDYEDIDEKSKHDVLRFPYIPGGQKLESKTLPPHLTHYGGRLHKDIHNMYGMMETYETYQAQLELGKPLPFIISRSTFPGSGHFTQHWFGDNAATYDFMYLSVGQVFQFGIFGIPMVGADVCGFLQNTTSKLCARWVQLGAIYPFFRNHNNDLASDQEFYSLGEDVLHSAQKNIKLRYSIIRWYYTLFIQSNHTGMVFKPLFFEFTNDFAVLKDDVMDTQIMLGSELMATPILVQGQTTRKAYFPKSAWYQFQSGAKIQSIKEPGQDHYVLCNYDDFLPLFIRGGKILLRQDVTNALTLHDLTNHYFGVIAIEENDSVGYHLDVPNYNDSTILEECDKSNCLLNITFSIKRDQAIFRIIRALDGAPPKYPIFIDKLRIYGLPNITNFKCDSQISITCESGKTDHYSYNSIIIINSGEGIEFGQLTGVFEIKILF